MEHYICTGGCRGESQMQDLCQATGCPKHEHALEKCDCTDGKHHGAFDFQHDHEHSLPEKSEESK